MNLPLPLRSIRGLLLLLSLTYAHLGWSINEPTIGDFNGEMEPESLDGSGDSYGLMSGGLILGQVLDVEVSGTSTAEVTGSALSFEASGSVVLTWDGEDESPALDPYGLANINLTEEEIGFTTQDAFLLSFTSVSSGGDYMITVYSDEESFSVTSGLVSPSDSDLVIPYSAFIADPGGDGTDFSRVTAIQITFSNGLVADLDQFQTTSALGGMTMVDNLQIDLASNALVDPGDTIRYTITVPASASGTGVVVSVTPHVDTPLVVGSVTTNTGTVTLGNTSGDSEVSVAIGTLPSSEVEITFDCVIADPLSTGSPVCNQASLSTGSGSSILSDDPDNTTSLEDPTCTVVFVDTTAPVLTLPADIELSSGEDTSPEATGTATATDNVTANPIVDYSDSTVDGPLPFAQTITRTWSASDEAGNTSYGDQIITVTGIGPAFALTTIPDRPVLGIFSPVTSSSQRQLGSITTGGAVSLLGNANSLSASNIAMASGLTAFNRQTQTVYTIGRTLSDNLSRVFSVKASDGSASSAVLSSGTLSSLIGIWFDDSSLTLYAVFQVGAGLSDRQLASIDPDTGSVSFIGTPNSSISGSIAGTLTGSSDKGEIYFLGTTGGLPGSLITVDLTSGDMAATPLVGTNYNVVAGMEYSSVKEQLYVLLIASGERQLAELDTDTGVFTPLGTSTIGGGGVVIATYLGVNTIEEYTGTFLFIGRYTKEGTNVWAIWGVDLTSGESTYSNIDTSLLADGNYFGLEYANLRLNALQIDDFGFSGADFYIDMANGTSDLAVSSSDDLESPFLGVSGVSETIDDEGQPNRFLIPAASLNADKDFFRVEIEPTSP